MPYHACHMRMPLSMRPKAQSALCEACLVGDNSKRNICRLCTLPPDIMPLLRALAWTCELC